MGWYDNDRKKVLSIAFCCSIEIVAAIGLVFILFYGFGTLKELNNEVASALEQPTLTPTALISAVILPSGHTPPNAEGGAQYNEAEIPEHLRPIVQSLGECAHPHLQPGTSDPDPNSIHQSGCTGCDG